MDPNGYRSEMSPEPDSSPADVALFRLEQAIEGLKAAVASGYERRVLASLNEAGSALYSVWLFEEVRGRDQVAWAAEDPERRNVVGLVYARGEAEHQKKHVGMAAGFGEAPFGFGPFGGGWLWRECPTTRPAYASSQALYDEQVRWKSLAEPLERAYAWFVAHPR